MNINFTPDFIYFTNVTPQERNRLENYHNTVFSKKNGWRLPLNIWCMRELGKDFPPLLHNSEFVNQGKRLREEMDRLLTCRRASIHFHDESGLLRPYQAQDVYYLHKLSQAGIFNEPRTGKTPTTITLIKELKTKCNLIVCPASLVWNWAEEFAKWYPCILVTVMNHTPKKRQGYYEQWHEKTGVMIISKDTLKTDIAFIEQIQFDLCAVDEAHFLRNWKTKQSEAVCKIKAKRKYVLTGTPTVKHPSDIFGLLQFLFPQKFTSYWQFCDRYFDVYDENVGPTVIKKVGRVKKYREQELQEMIGLISVQRKRKEVMPWLPDKQYMTIPVELEGKQAKMYKNMLDYFQTFLEEDNLELFAQNVLTQLMRLRQICLDPRLVGGEGEGAKTKAIYERLEDNHDPVIIMSMFTSYLNLLRSRLEEIGLKVGMIHGEMDSTQKQMAANQFQAGQIDILLCNVISAGTGFTLDRAETIIFTDKPWNPSDMEQAEDRITPVSKERIHKHTIISFVARNTVDEKLDKILAQKKSLTDILNEGGRQAIRRLLT